MARIDKDSIKQAASGKWKEIIENLGAVDSGSLDCRHHPCPKCGGTDRFRAFDDFEQTGGLLCNQCGKFPDGFASVQWLTGLSFRDSMEAVAKFMGLEVSKTPRKKAVDKKDAKPDDQLEFIDWSSALAASYIAKKPLITEEALFLAGARMAYYKSFTVICLPIIGQDLDVLNPVGWVMLNHNGEPLPKWDRQGNVVGETKAKISFGSKPGLLNSHAIERLKTPGLVEYVIKVEGITDMLALQAIIPPAARDRCVVVTNSSGCGQKPGWMADILATTHCSVIHDCDRPGAIGARMWSEAIASRAPINVDVRNVELPFEISEVHGKDLSDFIGEPGRSLPFNDLVDLMNATKPIGAVPFGPLSAHQSPEDLRDAMILRRFRLEVVSENADSSVVVFSQTTRKNATIRNIDKLTKMFLVQICTAGVVGPLLDKNGDGADTFTLDMVKEAIANIASRMRSRELEKGVGIWQGVNEDGSQKEVLVLANDSEAAIFDPMVGLLQVITPRVEGLILDFGRGDGDWYRFAEMEANIGLAGDIVWREAVIHELVDLFSQWRWRNQNIDPVMMAGLVLATYCQTIFDWRPMVSIVGSSGSGKSFLFEALAGNNEKLGMFGRLSFKSAQSTEAGIRQGIGKTAKVILYDEFEQSAHREKILSILRNSSRGEAQTKGSTDGHNAKTYVLKHIAWVAAIESGIFKQADENRFIEMELLPAEENKQGQLRLPDERTLVEMGKKLVAIAIFGALRAKSLCRVLKDVQVKRVVGRIVESYSVPVACLAAAQGMDDDEAKDMLVKLIEASKDDPDAMTIETDQETLLAYILSRQVLVEVSASRRDTRAISQVIHSSALLRDNSQLLESFGIRVMGPDDFNRQNPPKGNWLVVEHKSVTANLFKGESCGWTNIDKLLHRLPGVSRRKEAVKIGGVTKRCVLIPLELCDGSREVIREEIQELKDSMVAPEEDEFLP